MFRHKSRKPDDPYVTRQGTFWLLPALRPICVPVIAAVSHANYMNLYIYNMDKLQTTMARIENVVSSWLLPAVRPYAFAGEHASGFL